MDIACLVKTFQAIVDLVLNLFEAVLFRTVRSGRREPILVTKADPSFLPETLTGPLLHTWQHMCTVHLPHDLRLIEHLGHSAHTQLTSFLCLFLV